MEEKKSLNEQIKKRAARIQESVNQKDFADLTADSLCSATERNPA
jgi:hypothetical protein